jgi:hypothetical protein
MLQKHGILRALSLKYFERTVLATAALLLVGNAASAADETFVSRDNVTLPSGQHITSFDISFVDPVISLYLLADRTNKSIDVIETDTNTVFQLSSTPPFAGATGNNDTPMGW